MNRPNKTAFPILCLSPPPNGVMERGGWFDPFSDEFVCVVARNCAEHYGNHEPSQSYANFAAAHDALAHAYKGRCICASCQKTEVDMTDLYHSGLVIAVFNADAYDYHVATGAGICEFCAWASHDLVPRMTDGFRTMLTQGFALHRAKHLN